jgi:hypothetical protein
MPDQASCCAAQVINYVLARPAREVLFTVTSREEKYAAKLCIDTLVVRGGDALSAGAFHVLDGLLHLGECRSPLRHSHRCDRHALHGCLHYAASLLNKACLHGLPAWIWAKKLHNSHVRRLERGLLQG